jgi:hypothetical protein
MLRKLIAEGLLPEQKHPDPRLAALRKMLALAPPPRPAAAKPGAQARPGRPRSASSTPAARSVR